MRPRKIEATMLVEIDGEDQLVSLYADYYPGTPDVPYLRNGDPGYPGDPPEVDNIRAYFKGVEITLYEQQLIKAEEILLEKGGEEV